MRYLVLIIGLVLFTTKGFALTIHEDVPSINLSALNNLSVSDTARVDKVLEHTEKTKPAQPDKTKENDPMTLFTTVFGTVCAGTVVFIFGQTVLKFMLEPIQHLRELRGEIAHVMIVYKNVYGSFEETKKKEAQEVFRVKAGQLEMARFLIPKYDWWTKLGKLSFLPKRSAIKEAHEALLEISGLAIQPLQVGELEVDVEAQQVIKKRQRSK